MEEPVENCEDDAKINNPRLVSILLYILSALLLCCGMLDILTWKHVFPLPQWLDKALSLVQPVESLRGLLLWANNGVIAVGLGFWTMVAAFWMSKKMPGHILFAMMVLSLAVLLGGMSVVRWVAVPSSFDPFFWPDYIYLAIVLLGISTTVFLVNFTSFQRKPENSE